MIRITIACCIALTAGCVAGSQLDGATTVTRVDSSAFIPMAKAIEIAQKRVPAGVAIDAELERHCACRGGLAYEIDFRVPGKAIATEVAVHAITGKVIAVGPRKYDDDEDDLYEGME